MQKQVARMTAKSPSPLLPLSPPLSPFSSHPFRPSVFNPAQFARLDETILVISACNDTLLTPITTIKTLLPLGPFQVLINQMAAKRPPPPTTTATTAAAAATPIHTPDIRIHTLAGTHTHLLTSLDRPCGPAKKHIWRNKTSPCWQTNASTLQMKDESLASPLSLSLSHCLFLSPSL